MNSFTTKDNLHTSALKILQESYFITLGLKVISGQGSGTKSSINYGYNKSGDVGQLRRAVKVKNGTHNTDYTVPAGSIIQNIPGGVFAKEPDRFGGERKPITRTKENLEALIKGME